MSFYKDLIKNKNSYNGRLNMTIFYVNVFLVLAHVFLAVFYAFANHGVMFIVNLFSLVFYLLSLKFSIKHKEAFLRIAFVEIWLHTLLGICSFGWDGYFQNWIFALLAAVFLSALNKTERGQSYKQSIIFSSILVLSYLLFALLVNTCKISFMIELNHIMKNIIFAFNNLLSFTAIIFFAITYTRNKEEKEFELIRKANYDELTGIFNRHALDAIVDSYIENKQNTYCVAILDIDDFKKVNDTYGHKSGDMVLRKLGKILESYSDKDITVGRWGGEEFLILGGPSTDYDKFVTILEDFRNTVENTQFKIKNKKEIRCTISIGSKFVKKGYGLNEAVSKADTKLYKAKHTGKNKVVS